MTIEKKLVQKEQTSNTISVLPKATFLHRAVSAVNLYFLYLISVSFIVVISNVFLFALAAGMASAPVVCVAGVIGFVSTLIMDFYIPAKHFIWRVIFMAMLAVFGCMISFTIAHYMFQKQREWQEVQAQNQQESTQP